MCGDRKGMGESMSSGSAAADMVLDYLKRANRPYSASMSCTMTECLTTDDISLNLKNAISKPHVVKCLAELHKAGLINSKVYSGKVEDEWACHSLQQESKRYISPDKYVNYETGQLLSSETGYRFEQPDQAGRA